MKKMIAYIVSIAMAFSALPMTVFATEDTGAAYTDVSHPVRVEIPIGAYYLKADGDMVELDTPAYISEEGYSMLPVRAVALALAINRKGIIWDAETRTLTILYGQRVITMAVGAKEIGINDDKIEASAAAEIVEGRMFLPLRDIVLALGLPEDHIVWDGENRTVILNEGLSGLQNE